MMVHNLSSSNLRATPCKETFPSLETILAAFYVNLAQTELDTDPGFGRATDST